jgi:hypothetical protein
MHTCNATTLDQLLSLRDGVPLEAYIVQHVNTCSTCARELERLHDVRSALQALPGLTAPSYAAVMAAAVPDTTRHRFRLVGTAVAAAIVGAIALSLVTAHPSDHPSATPDQSPATTAVLGPMHMATDPPIASLVIRSQDLEARLRRLPSRPIVERASTTTTIDSLQSSIQWVDYQLSVADDVGLSERQAAQLWEDRIQLMDSLVKVRFAEVQRFAVLQ